VDMGDMVAVGTAVGTGELVAVDMAGMGTKGEVLQQV